MNDCSMVDSVAGYATGPATGKNLPFFLLLLLLHSLSFSFPFKWLLLLHVYLGSSLLLSARLVLMCVKEQTQSKRKREDKEC